MISSETVAWSSLLLTQVVTIAGRGLTLAAGAGLGLTAFRVKSTGLRLFTWTAVLYAIIAVSLMGWLPAVPVPMPMFLPGNGCDALPRERHRGAIFLARARSQLCRKIKERG